VEKILLLTVVVGKFHRVDTDVFQPWPVTDVVEGAGFNANWQVQDCQLQHGANDLECRAVRRGWLPVPSQQF